MSSFSFRTGFNYDVDQVSFDAGLSCPESDSVVQTQFADEADINTIVRRFGVTGVLPQALRLPSTGDFTLGASSFHEALTLVRQAEEEFMKLPADVRVRFGHDPGRVIAFLDDPANREEAVKLGLVAAPVERDRAGGVVDGGSSAVVSS